jgi:hypothetical protein
MVARTAAQPHRRGERTTAGATGWQRLLRSGAIADRNGRFTAGELELAGLRFAEVRLHYIIAIGCPIAWANSPASGKDIPAATRNRWIADWAELLSGLRTRGPMPIKSLVRAVEAHPEAEEREWPSDFVAGVQEGLIALAGQRSC